METGAWKDAAERDRHFMEIALREAAKAAAAGEVPVGAVLVRGDEVLAAAGNERERLGSALAHAEMTVIRRGNERLAGWRLSDCELYVTLEPCPMCAGAIVNARIPRVVIGEKNVRAGAFGTVLNLNRYPLNHRPALVFGVLADESAALLKRFFSARR